jgi:regulator of sigma E protease
MAKPALLVTRKLPPAVEARAARDYAATLNADDQHWATDGAEIIRRATALGAAGILCAAGDRLDAACIAALPGSVKAIATFSVGFEHVDLAAAKARGIVVANTPDVLSFATAECAFTLMLMAARRAGKDVTLTLPAHNTTTNATLAKALGVDFTTGFRMTHPSPIAQITAPITMTVRTLWSLINPNSDIGISKLAGPVGIARIFHSAAEAGIRAVLMFTILININLAVFNLLPIPVLDGGQMLFATIGKLRGRALPVNFIMTAQSVFMVLLFSMVIYVSFFDVRRIVRDVNTSRAESAAPAK